MRLPALRASLALLLPCYGSFAATAPRKLPTEDPRLPPEASLLAAPLVGSATTTALRSRTRLPKVSTWRRLDESLERCDRPVDFTTHIVTTLANSPRFVAAADLDGDADFDLLAAIAGGGIVWYENFEGTGNFSGSERVITTETFVPRSAAAADLDGDGDLDVLSASQFKIAWYENLDGAGDYSGPQRVITDEIYDARSIAAADLDGDGDLDVLSASTREDKIFWYENLQGAGEFSGPQRVITTQVDDTQSVVAADLDGDRDLDVLSASSLDDKIAWYENLDGAGDFSGPQRVITTLADGATSVVAADLDGDGDLDVVSASSGDDKIAWYENLDGAGNFSGPQHVITTQADIPVSVAAADLDNDGDLDILSASVRDDKIAWYENLDGAGNLSGPQRIIATLAQSPESIAAADLDGDGDLDVLSASSRDDMIAWYENECGPLTPQPTPEVMTPPLCDGLVDFTAREISMDIAKAFAAAVAAADLDGDRDLDVVLATDGEDMIVWYENMHPSEDFSQWPRVITTQSIGASSVAAADLDGDGDLDVLSASSRDNKIAWYENLDGAGDFSGPQHVITTLADSASSVAAADLDNDSDLDVLSASFRDDKIAWYENLDGAGNFLGPQRVITTQANGATSVAAADLDGDSDFDVLSASNYDYKIAWYENLDGAGNFSGPQRVITTEADLAQSVAAADLDGDSDFDVLSASRYDDKVAWYENLDGTGDFSGPQRVITTLLVDATSVVAADLDGDGDLDVVAAAAYWPGELSWYENLDGAGDFSGPKRVIKSSDGNTFPSIAAADLDGDGDFDVLSALGGYHGKFAWYKNECGPMTPQPTLEPTTPQPTPKPLPTPEPTYWGPQVFGKKPQTVGFQRACVAWCILFGVISVGVLRCVVHAPQQKGMNLARIILTVVLSQYDYGSDTLFIGFHNFVTPTLFVAALLTYLIPFAVFIVVYRRIIGVHIACIYTSTKAKTKFTYDPSNELQQGLAEIASVTLFSVAFAASTIVYLILLFFLISCKLMTVSFFAAKFYEAGGFACTQEAFEVMFKRNILSELVFESSGELIIALVDYYFRAQQDFRSNTGFSSWALLSIVGSSLMLAIEAWPYLYNIVLTGRGLDAGVNTIPTNLNFTPDEVLGTWLIDRLARFARLYAPDGQTVNDDNPVTSEIEIQVHEVKIVGLPEPRGH